ncbi:WXG100 family type VII secretion target [Glutamicibacter soli]|uniref:ESAT-6-like protein n=1 Tax=Glutamicibacter soli TaxID=453836 RepID=A0A365YM39_9MICC|nr:MULTISPECIES: WXG100 family type VII secretion target [Micrococcaceae]ALD63018.1 type VII secretion protein [Arthrobacter sp. LS16]RBM03054.1 WXG100 family type VII secretion target [Glutamicibacter soli]RKS21153.1 WXG100 family type VII secretion target [Arthrobacter sp. AG1021]
MSTFSTNTGEMQAKSQAVMGTIDRLRSEVATMQMNLDQLQGTWHGSAAASFQAIVAEWRSTHLRIEEALGNIATALHHASAQYEEVEQVNTSLFRY